jgi:superfamily II DNA/RNA helicase
MASRTTLEIVREVRRHMAGRALTERQAKLYSQRLRRDMGQEGLVSFLPGDVSLFLEEAMLLLQCGLIERDSDPESEWRHSIKRAAEIVELLSHPALKPSGAPLHLLTAAAYQLADYPAMALGHLRHVPDDQHLSSLLREFLRANFPATIEEIRKYWQEYHTHGISGQTDPSDLTSETLKHVIMCIGSVCAYLRTGSDETTERSLIKLDSLAASFLHSRDPYSYLLARLTAESCRRFVKTCLWRQIDRLREASSATAGAALIQFAKSSFVNRRVLVWPAQSEGIDRLYDNSSFVVCTPTGSGKTTVATLAIVQSLFSNPPVNPFDGGGQGTGNLMLYLVPSRALAAEVESRLAQDLKGIAAEPVTVTGLYGGVDWGPTDAWIQTERATIIICTFEKADALLRYLGVLFLNRVRLIVIDEAHMVEQNKDRLSDIEDGSSRAFRLEQLGVRLLRARNVHNFRIIALSAVAARAAPAIARWISGSPKASPATSSYRSTRQMLGRLEVSAGGQFTIRYDLMDGESLRFDDEGRTDSPYVRAPFPSLPGGISAHDGPEVRMRGPTLWAALQLAAERPDGSTPSVLISLTERIESFSATCVDLMDSWPPNLLPKYWSIHEDDDLWIRCLASAEDYFTAESVEYRLLQRGIAVHHGKMPGLLARRLKAVIDRGFVRVIIATSTLSEGVNIPINFLLIPSVFRANSVLSLQEFTNLIGRAGRPGVATEGSALIVLPERTRERDRLGRLRLTPNRQWDGYQHLTFQLEKATTAIEGTLEDAASSPLAHLLRALRTAWADLSRGDTQEEFEAWLEQTAVPQEGEDMKPAHNYLDSLDAFLLAAIHEVETLRDQALAPHQMEEELTAIWQRTYAFAAAQEETQLSKTFLARGRAIKTLYPDEAQRRRIYRTSLSPRSALTLLNLADLVRNKLQEGENYALWEDECRLTFIHDVLELLSSVSSFKISTRLGRRGNFQDWPKLLRWWLAKGSLRAQPKADEITTWYEFVSQNFIYRGAWGLGSIIGLLLDGEEDGQPIQPLEIEDWPRSGLPWIAFWMKELITWGTLDPVAAFLLARGGAVDRPGAEAAAIGYYENLAPEADPNTILDPRQIRNWVEAQRNNPPEAATIHELSIRAMRARPAADYLRERISVSPIEVEGSIAWIDPAGYIVARSEKPGDWPENPSSFHFDLNVRRATIKGKLYLQSQIN